MLLKKNIALERGNVRIVYYLVQFQVNCYGCQVLEELGYIELR